MTAPPQQATTVQARMSAELTRRLGPYADRLGWDASQLARHQRERLRLLLAHAAEHSRSTPAACAGWIPAGSSWPT